MKEMKSLVYLDIRDCHSLKGVPSGMGQLKGMRKLSKFIVGKKNGCKIGELNELNDLEGELSISCLGNVKNVAEAESANLMGKKMLTSLKLEWEEENNYKLGYDIDMLTLFKLECDRITEENNGIVNDDMEEMLTFIEWSMRRQENNGIVNDGMEVLSALQPHQNLRKLVIRGYGSLKLPNWMMDLHIHLPNLVEIELVKLSQCQQLQIPLGRVGSLKVLKLSGMSCLNHIGVEVYGHGESAAFPSLEKLTLHQMSSLKEWAEITTTTSRAASPFPRLHELSIQHCLLLTKFPTIPSVQVLSLDESTATTSQLMVLVQANFVGLKSLSLDNCRQLESLPELDPNGVWYSSWLRHLSIGSCHEFTTLSDDGLRHLTSLQTLYFCDCPKMTSLPESIQHLTALQSLTIVDCEGLSSLPDGMKSLTTLATLHIVACPDLESWCEKDKGEDWPKIAHIPSIFINHKRIQLLTK